MSDARSVPDTLQVLVVDDHHVVRAGTRSILEDAGIGVAGEAATAEDALAQLEAAGGDQPVTLVLADVRLPGRSGIELAAAVRERWPAVRVLILSSFADPGYARAALDAGAAGYVVKTASDEELLAAVRSAALGATVLDPAVSAGLLAGAGSSSPLTERERQVVELVIEGLPNKAVATRLGVSRRTVDAHLAHLFTKLGLSSRAELVAWAARHGMIAE